MGQIEKIIPLVADTWKMDGGVAFGVVPKSIWNRNNLADENNMIPIVTRSLLISSSNKLILVDVGMGRKREKKYYKVRGRETDTGIEKSLNEAGYSPHEITDILFTHLHDDHVGAAIEKDLDANFTPLFPNAEYHVSKAQWDWAMNPNKREGASYFADNLLPLQENNCLHFIEKEGEWLTGINLRIYNGHTMGQLIPFIRYKQRTVVFGGDFIPTSFNIPLAFVPSVDIQPLVSMEEKMIFLEEAVNSNFIMLFEHDYYTECCTFKQSERGVVTDQSFEFNSVFY